MVRWCVDHKDFKPEFKETAEELKQLIYRPYYNYLAGKDASTDPVVNPNYITPKNFMMRLVKCTDEYGGGVGTYYTTSKALLDTGFYLLGMMEEDSAKLAARDLHELLRCWENYHRLWTVRLHMQHIAFREESRYPGFYGCATCKLPAAPWNMRRAAGPRALNCAARQSHTTGQACAPPRRGATALQRRRISRMSNSILVVGGGFAGLTAAIEAAELGHDVYIVEKSPYLGGRVAQLNKYFPKLCPPSCGLEIQFQRIRKNPRIKFFTMAEVTKLVGCKGDYTATVSIKPRKVAAHNVDFTLLASSLEGTVPNEFDFGLSRRKALYKSMPFAFPNRFVLDTDALSKADAARVAGQKFLDQNEPAREIELNVGAIVVATGWKPYDVTNLANLGAGKVKNCVTNMQLERLASPFGPTGGKIVRPTDGRRPKRIAFVQCAGSRDQNHLNYCSYICCMATLKQCQYICEQYPETQISVFYIDLRAPGRYVKVLDKVKAAPNVRFIKGKVADVAQAADDNVTVTVEDAIRGEKLHLDYDMVVLATGMQPSLATDSLPLPLPLDEDGFVMGGEEAGIFAAGCARMPLDVMRTAQSGTAAALKAVQTVKGR